MLLLSFDSAYIQPIDLYEMELGLTIFFLFIHALFFFTFFSISGIFLVLGITFGLTILVRCFWESSVDLIDSTVEKVKDWSSIETVYYSMILSSLLYKCPLFYPNTRLQLLMAYTSG